MANFIPSGQSLLPAGGSEPSGDCQPYQLRQAARSALAEATRLGSRLLVALEDRSADEVAQAVAAAAAPPPAKKGRKMTAAAAAAQPPCPIRCRRMPLPSCNLKGSLLIGAADMSLMSAQKMFFDAGAT